MSKVVMVLGGDGYIGWSFGLHRALTTNDRVVLVDSYLKRSLQEEVGVQELCPIPELGKKVKLYQSVTGKRNLESACLDVSNYQSIEFFIDKIKPDVILNAAQQPSAPLSMMSPRMASLTLTNNQQSTLNVLWAVAKISPKTLVINMGSAGAYLSIDSDFIPDKRTTLYFRVNGDRHFVANSWLPMLASDFYHQSKANTFSLADICTDLWGLNVVTVQQSTVFGQCVSKNLPFDLYARMNYDHLFGTVLNRFVCQAVSNHPLTVYGDGSNRTNIISLCDTIKSLNTLIEMPSSPGEHRVINNFTDSLSIEQIANLVILVYGRGRIEHIENPRSEKKMSMNKEFEPFIIGNFRGKGLDECVLETLDYTQNFRYNIKTDLFNPTVKWDVRGENL